MTQQQILLAAYGLLAAYCLLIVAGSWLGGWLPSRVRLTHTRMQLVMSMVGGLMLGVGLLHMLPHSHVQTGSLDVTIAWALGGLLTTFFMIRVFDFHHHATAESESEGEHSHCDQADPAHQGSHQHHHDISHRTSWVGVALGLGLHTLIDGIALGAAVLAAAEHSKVVSLWGVGVFLAVLLHKPLDALSITSLMAASGWPPKMCHRVNTAFAMMCPAGAALVVVGIDLMANERGMILGYALGFSAGVFLCISLGDLLPELQFHRHDRVKLSIALLMGVAIAYGIRYLEPEHVHGQRPQQQRQNENTPNKAPVRTTALGREI